MIRSMTGFGRGEYTDESGKLTVEIKSVNSRYLDISVRMPRKYAFAEETLRTMIRERIHRGKVDVNVEVNETGRSGSDVVLDRDLAAKYISAFTELASMLGDSSAEPPLSLLAGMPDVISTKAAEEDSDTVVKRLAAAAAAALDDICAMKEAEGAKLAEDLISRADTLSGIREDIEKRAPQIEKEYSAKFKVRVEELLDGVYELPEDRIALEAAVFADKANITEELVRLDSHISQLKAFMEYQGNEAIGKKIDFLIQEMNREANTIGSKSNDGEITSMMLEMKAEIEKIREQVQNIE